MHCKMFEPRLPFEGLRRLFEQGPEFLSSGRKPLECQCFHGMHRQDRAEDGGSSQKGTGCSATRARTDYEYCHYCCVMYYYYTTNLNCYYY